MRRVPLLAPFVLVFALLVGGPLAARVAAQGTPEPGAAAPGFQVLAFAAVADVPPAPAIMALIRLSYAPGASFDAPAYPGPVLGVIESGTVTAHASAPVTVRRAAEVATPTAAPTVTADITLEPGDTILTVPGTSVTYRNTGSTTAVALITGVVPATFPLTATYPSGVTADLLAAGVATATPTAPAALVMVRDTLAAGASQPPSEPDAGPLLAYVDHGTLGYTPTKGTSQITRAGSLGTPAAAATPGAEMTLAQGDSVFEQTGTVSGVRNTGSGPASVILVTLVPPGALEGTPAA